MANTENSSDPMAVMTILESYGELPVHILRMDKRMNISPCDWMMLEFQYEQDFEAMRDFINLHRHPKNGSFIYPLGGMA